MSIILWVYNFHNQNHMVSNVIGWYGGMLFMLGAAMKLINSDSKTFEFAFVGLDVSECLLFRC